MALGRRSFTAIICSLVISVFATASPIDTTGFDVLTPQVITPKKLVLESTEMTQADYVASAPYPIVVYAIDQVPISIFTNRLSIGNAIDWVEASKVFKQAAEEAYVETNHYFENVAVIQNNNFERI